VRAEAIHREIDEEARFHIEMRIDENIRRGMSPEEARLDAERRFGNLTRMKERGYQVRGGRWLEPLWHDLRFGVRMLLKKPGFTLIAVITLSLGIGANTAIFSVVYAALLKPLPYRDPDRLVFLRSTQPNGRLSLLSFQEFNEFREQSGMFESLAAEVTQSVNLTGVSQPDRLRGGFVSANFFETFKIAPLIGRTFAQGEDGAGAERVVVISQNLWQSRLNSDPNLDGRTLILNDYAHRVIGVVPASFRHPLDEEVELWMPGLQTYQPGARPDPTARYLTAMGYLKPGTPLEQVQAELAGVANRLALAYPKENAGRGVRLVSAHEYVVRGYRPAMRLLLGAVGLILLIACANVANLLLSRGAARQREFAVRVALGGSRLRLIRQLLTEATLLSLIGGGIGLLIAALGLEALLAIKPDGLQLREVRLDALAMAFTFGVSVLSGILFGIAPAFQLANTRLQTALKEGGSGGDEGPFWRRTRGVFVVAQVALSLALLIGSGLLIKSFYNLLQIDLGFEPENVLTMQYRLPRTRFGQGGESQWDFHRQVVERIKEVPGVKSAGLIRGAPLSEYNASAAVVLPDRERPPKGGEPRVYFNTATRGYFETMGIPLLRGRHFDEQDAGDRPPVFLVNQAMASKLWPNEDPIGKQIQILGNDIPGTIIGVVGDSKQQSLWEAQSAQMYAHYGHMPGFNATIVVRTTVEPMSLSQAVREAVWKVDPDQPMWAIRTVERMISSRLGGLRFMMILIGVFAALASVLATVGVYGVMSHAVSQGIREIGIRMVFGANRRDVLLLVIAQGMKLVVAGVALGLLAAFGLTRWLNNLLYEVRPTDPATYLVIALLLTAVALLACYVPARRAAKSDPMNAIRHD
jgi:putative ABC transport system permease protein